MARFITRFAALATLREPPFRKAPLIEAFQALGYDYSTDDKLALLRSRAVEVAALEDDFDAKYQADLAAKRAESIGFKD